MSSFERGFHSARGSNVDDDDEEEQQSLTGAASSTSNTTNNINNSKKNTRKQRLQNRLSQVGKTLQKFNLAKLIDDMEQDQELADDLDALNHLTTEDVERREMVQEAVRRCHDEIETHLTQFLKQQRNEENGDNDESASAAELPTYEDWISDLHPENVEQGKLLCDLQHIDARFYVEASDHRLLWNDRVPAERQVASRSSSLKQQQEHEGDERLVNVDLLDDDGG